MTTENNKEHHIETVKAFLALQYEGKIEEAFSNYAHEDFSWIVSSQSNKELNRAIPWAGVEFRGLEGYKKLTSLLFGEFEPLEFKPISFYSVDDIVFMVGHFEFKHRLTEKIASSDFIGLFRMRNSKIEGGQFYENTFAVAEARQ